MALPPRGVTPAPAPRPGCPSPAAGALSPPAAPSLLPPSPALQPSLRRRLCLNFRDRSRRRRGAGVGPAPAPVPAPAPGGGIQPPSRAEPPPHPASLGRMRRPGADGDHGQHRPQRGEQVPPPRSLSWSPPRSLPRSPSRGPPSSPRPPLRAGGSRSAEFPCEQPHGRSPPGLGSSPGASPAAARPVPGAGTRRRCPEPPGQGAGSPRARASEDGATPGGAGRGPPPPRQIHGPAPQGVRGPCRGCRARPQGAGAGGRGGGQSRGAVGTPGGAFSWARPFPSRSRDSAVPCQ